MFEAAAKFKLTIGCTFLFSVASACSAPSQAQKPDSPPNVTQTTAQPIPKPAAQATKEPKPEPQTTPIPKPAPVRPLVIAVISDLNGAYGSTQYSPAVTATVTWLCDELRPDLVISTGDLVAGMKPGLDYPAMWQAFHDAVTHPLQNCGIPFVPVPGNHDAAPTKKFAPERDEYLRQWKDRFPALHKVDLQDWPWNFSFEVHLPDTHQVRFVGLDLTVPRKLRTSELNWLETQLQTSTPTLVFGHVPIVPVAHNRPREASNDLALAAILAKDADIFLHGHHHVFFPHQALGVPTLSVPNLGSGSRAWATAQPADKRVGGNGLVVLTIAPDELQWQAFHVPGFAPWSLDELPAAIQLEDTAIPIWNP